jgi:hypothetical protein
MLESISASHARYSRIRDYCVRTWRFAIGERFAAARPVLYHARTAFTLNGGSNMFSVRRRVLNW